MGDHLVEVDLGAKPQHDGIARPDVLGVPVGPVAHRADSVLGGAQQLADLRVGHVGDVAQQPGDGVGLVLALRQRGVAGAPGLGDRHLALFAHDQTRAGVGDAALELLAAELAVGDRVEADDPHRHLAVGDGVDLEQMQHAERGDLLEGERGVVDHPHGGGLGHQRLSHQSSRYLVVFPAISAPGPVAPRGTACPRPAGYRGPGAGRNVLVPPIGAGRNAEAMLPRLGGRRDPADPRAPLDGGQRIGGRGEGAIRAGCRPSRPSRPENPSTSAGRP